LKSPEVHKCFATQFTVSNFCASVLNGFLIISCLFQVLESDPNNVKALFRKGQALVNLKDWDKAEVFQSEHFYFLAVNLLFGKWTSLTK
jgi:hypothetical protein